MINSTLFHVSNNNNQIVNSPYYFYINILVIKFELNIFDLLIKRFLNPTALLLFKLEKLDKSC